MPQETRWWRQEDGRVVCELCPRGCRIAPGKQGFCFVRANVDGRTYRTDRTDVAPTCIE